jgi:3'-phosphoadenosine 5'-phosphosulfate sulfotransferase (PAPS reductase)/FAD synthetase
MSSALNDIDNLVIGGKWNENLARLMETFFLTREDSKHSSVYYVLSYTEKYVWEFALVNELLVHSLYYKGYRCI